MYKNISISLLALSLNATLLNADTYTFVGGQTSINSYDGVTAPSLGIQYGKQIDSWRTTISAEYLKKNDDTLKSLVIQVDQGVLSHLFSNSSIQPYVGFNIGLTSYANNVSSDSTLTYGVNGGIAYILNNDMDIDIGLRTMKVSELGMVTGLTASLHYFY